MAGASLIYGAGMLELGVTMSAEELLIDHDIISMIMNITRGIPVNEETLAVDVAAEIGAGGSFIGHESTLAHFNQQSDPVLFDRRMIGDWAKDGSKNIVDVAHEAAMKIKKEHKPVPLNRDILRDVKAVVKESDRNYKG